MNRGAWWAPVHGVKRVRHDWSHLAQHSKFYKVKKKKKRKTESLASILSRGICIFGTGEDLLIGFQVHGWFLIGCNGTTKWSGDNFKKKKKGKWSHSVMFDSLWHHGLQSTRLLHPWDLPGKSTRVGCHFLLQGIFLTQGSNLGVLHCR